MIAGRTAPLEAKAYPGTQSILRAIAILKCFDDDRQEWNLSDLAARLDLNKTTVFRLLSALESEGLVARAGGGERYMLGSELVAMGGYALRGIDWRAAAHQGLEKLAAETNETASLEIVVGNEMLIIDEVIGGHLLGGVRSLGTRWPLHGTSTGLAILARWPAERREAYLDGNLSSLTPFTVTTAENLRALLSEFAVQGYAVSDEMLEPGLIAIGAPLLNYDHKIEAAISIYGPKNRVVHSRISSIGQLVQETAAEISYQLGYRDNQHRELAGAAH